MTVNLVREVSSPFAYVVPSLIAAGYIAAAWAAFGR